MTAMVAAVATVPVTRTEVEVDTWTVVGVIAAVPTTVTVISAMAPTMAPRPVAMAIAAHMDLFDGTSRGLQGSSRTRANGGCRYRGGEAYGQEPRYDRETKLRPTH